MTPEVFGLFVFSWVGTILAAGLAKLAQMDASENRKRLDDIAPARDSGEE